MPLYPHSILKKPKSSSADLIQRSQVPTSKEPIDVDAHLFDRPVAQPGTFADREHRKWTEQAITLQNNPYSRESIERRLAKGFQPENVTMSGQNIQNDGGFILSQNDNALKSAIVENGKEIIVTDLPRRIDCGPKSSNVSRYRRDYYVHPSRMENHDVTFNENNNLLKKFKISDSNGPQGELIERTKALLMSKITLEDSDNSERFLGTKYEKDLRIENVEDRSSDSEFMADSLDDQGVQDSGNGSSSEKSSTISKVESEIQRFQREIERTAIEKSRQEEWERRKISRVSSSMDSLLSAEEDLLLDSKVPALPPKGKFVSTGSLIPPALPPKQKVFTSQLGKSKKVSISTDEVRVIGIGGFSDESDEGDDDDDEPQSRHFKPSKYYVPLPLTSELSSPSNENISQQSDIPERLPSVKELANMFVVKQNPDQQQLRKKRVDSPLLTAFKSMHSTFEIHSLTARSVPRQFREVLKKSMPEKSDKNIKCSNMTNDNHSDTSTLLEDDFKNLITFNKVKTPNKASRIHPEYQRDLTRSPEHVGIPAVTCNMPFRYRSSSVGMAMDEITSDDSCVSPKPTRHRHSTHIRRKKNLQS